jgi:Flp pilus assembly protein TadB
MRIVLGLWLLQAFTAGSAWFALSGESPGEIFAWIGLTMSVGLLAALWLWTALRDQRRLGEARQIELMANRTAELQADLARQRAADTAKLRALTEKVARPQRSLLKVSLLAGGALGLCLALIVTQLVTLGFLAFAFAAGGGAGYMLRGRWARRALPAATESAAIPALAKPAVPRKGVLLLRSSKAKAA